MKTWSIDYYTLELGFIESKLYQHPETPPTDKDVKEKSYLHVEGAKYIIVKELIKVAVYSL